MTDPINPKAIIDELREAAREAAYERHVVEWDKALAEQMLTRAADTINALVKEMHARELHHFEEEQKSAELAAVVEKVRGIANAPYSGSSWADLSTTLRHDIKRALSTAPADALAEHDAALIESLAVAGYRDAERDIEAWLRERARQVREGDKK